MREENQTLATITLQNYFRLYEKLLRHDRHGHDRGRGVPPDLQAAGGGHPAEQARGPQDEDDLIYRTMEAKFNAVADDVAARHAAGSPAS